ncbi:hypothetical protein CASFOL_022311 [Castilleja foliolosa]|uniref:DUF1985 domain-containing protein n=1 Tax=Castilleja foliolosa TaxID=1961234 RepID=A0ABD3CWR1_9LAMI
MRKLRLSPTEEPCGDEMEAATLHQDSPEPATEGTAEEVQWTWKRNVLGRSKSKIKLYSKRSIIDQITTELKLIGDGVFQELINSCFGSLMRFDTQGVVCHAALDYLFAHEVSKADAGPDELWFRVGGRFIRFSKYEYALVTGLSFRTTTFDPSAEHCPPASGLFLRHYHDRKLTMDDLRRNFINGVFRDSPTDALKVAKLLLVYFLLFGLDGRRTYIDVWAWTLIEDNEGWETFMWGKYTYQFLLSYLQGLPPNTKGQSYHIYGYVWAFLIWTFESVPELGIICGVRTSDDVLPRCLRWRFPETRVDMEGFSDHQTEVHMMLKPSAEEKKQPYWEHMIHDDFRSDVCYIDQDNTTPINPSSGDVLPVCRRRGFEASLTPRSCSNYASPSTGKRKRTDPQTTHASDQEETIQKELMLVRQEVALVQQELPSVIRQEIHLKLKEILSGRSSPEMRDPTVDMQCDETEVVTPVVPRVCEKCKCVDTMVVTMSKEIQDLRHEKLAAIKTIYELKQKQLEADKVVDELRRKNLEANLKILEFDKAVELSNEAVNQEGEDKLIFELNEKIDELKNQNLESEQLLGGVQEKCKHLDTMVMEMGKEIDELRVLRHGKLGAINTVKELRLKQLEVDKVVEELKRKNLEANLRILELDKAVELLHVDVNQAEEDKLIFELNEKIKDLKTQNLETEGLVGVFQEKCKHFDTMVVEMGKEIDELRKEKSAAINTVKELKQKQSEADKVVEELKRENREANSRICGCSWGLKTAELYKLESDKAVEQYKRRYENLSELMMDTEVRDLSNHVNDVNVLTSSEEGRNLDIPDFNDSTPDDVENVVVKSRGVRSTSTGDRDSGLSKKGDRNSVQPRTRKNDDAHTVKASHGTQSGRNPPCTVEDNEHRDQSALEFNALNDEVSSDDSEDESCTDSRMDDLIASLRCEHLVRKWISEADMLQAFQHDEVLCMNAVCALYRQNIFARKPKRRSKKGRFIPVDPMSGCALAKYLIDGDRELRLRKSVSEVKKERPDVIGECRKLATAYVGKLFQIYSAADDPFFGQS